MGRKVEKLRAERRIERSVDPHKWAEDIENREVGRSVTILVLVALSAWMGWQVWTLRQDVDALQRTANIVPCEPTPGPSGEMPPPGFC